MRAVELNSAALGFGEELMMENAGSWVARLAYPEGNSFLVLAGKGGKGGDGLVAARHLALMGRKVKVLLAHKRCELKEITLKQLKRAEDTGVEVIEEPEEADVIIDALLGTGARGAPRGRVRELIEWANGTESFKVSVDVPSGADPDGGCELCFEADLVVTVHKPKPVLKDMMDKVVVVEIGIPRKADTHAGPGDALLARRRGRKGQNGRVGVVGGSELYQGAPYLAGLAAFRSGADLVFVYSPVRMDFPELIWRDRRDLKEKLASDKVDVLLVGPGLGRDLETLRAALEYAEESKAKVVLDADALKLLPKVGAYFSGRAVLTPHLGEARALLGREVGDDLESRVRAAEEIAKTYGACVILKGKVDVVHCGDKGVLNETGNEWMTVGGTGDVLAGVTAAYLGRDEPWWAAKAAAYLNGRAGEACYEEEGHASPDCLIRAVPRLAKAVGAK
ncbi:NAD(P)H-hydrate dehydratase [Ignicoccus hospitalis]|nr:NAD(P)H-hydrate dehydratase [Ignicoccus hospitalis]HIH90172.1 NAD(P)H-hydrate dehydratase [Desulfurococcaceae archaeon]